MSPFLAALFYYDLGMLTSQFSPFSQ